MPDILHADLPLSPGRVRELRVGDMVTLSGEIVITAGMPTHQRMVDLIDAGQSMPFDMAGAALIHFGGQSRTLNGKTTILYMNPTTSTRFNPFMPKIIRGLGLRVVGGKGGLDAHSAQAMREAGCVYLSFPGGACTLLSNAIREVVAVEWTDLLLHYRLVRMRVQDLGPGTVAIDAHGGNLYDSLESRAAERMPGILEQLRRSRVA